MPDVYERLAKKLDEMPQGYPSTDDGIELKILRAIFSPEDAEMAMNLIPFPETAEAIASYKLGRPVDEMSDILEDMAEKAQIGSHQVSGKPVYAFIGFFPGIWEYQVVRADPLKDKTLIEWCHAYFPSVLKQLGRHEPGLLRTIPVNERIESGAQVQRYEDIRKMVEGMTSFLALDCQCRKEQDILGRGCHHTKGNCLQVSREPHAYDNFPLDGKVISKTEALDILAQAEGEGLVHNAVYNTKEGHAAICNCCSCSCVVLKGVKELGATHVLAKSNFLALIDPDTCSRCGVCADERCPMDAISGNDETFTVLPDLCIGCGACTITCPTESITLVRKPEAEQDQPPENTLDWAFKRTANRQ